MAFFKSRSILMLVVFGVSLLLIATHATQGKVVNQCVNNNNAINQDKAQNIMCTVDNPTEDTNSPFNSDFNVYNEADAFRNLYFAYASYCKVPNLTNWNCKWCNYIPGFQIKTVVNHHSGQAYVGFDTIANQIVASFRGSHNFEDWVDNFEAFSIPYPGVNNGKIHKGFHDAWKDVESGIMTAIKELINEHKDADVLVNGHSLGGALAQLTALSVYDYGLEINNPINIISYTFGSPRWGNRVMANYYNARIRANWRITNVKDVVPSVPPLELGYYHTSTQIWYTSNNPLKYKQCSSVDGENCGYVGYSARYHLRYLGVYESCE